MKQLHQNLYVTGQISAADIEAMAKSGVKMILNNRPDNEQSGQMHHTEALALATSLGIAYHYLPMENGKPMPADLIDNFKDLVESTDETIVAHCRSGMRSSFIWALGQIADGKVSVDQAIEAANNAGIPLQSARPVLENAAP